MKKPLSNSISTGQIKLPPLAPVREIPSTTSVDVPEPSRRKVGSTMSLNPNTKLHKIPGHGSSSPGSRLNSRRNTVISILGSGELRTETISRMSRFSRVSRIR